MGVVYRATQLDLERTVALKVIAPALAEDPDFRARFVRESRVAASIDHPNVIPIYYAGENDGVLYIAMRYVEGEDMRALLRREGALEPGRAAMLVNQVAAALDAAHARGIVHRDVKPANVLLGASDHAYLTDFGLTKSVGSQSGLSHAGQWVGTLGYVSPEQIRGEHVDARADVYALGCLLFYALTGETPYRRDSDEATLWAHLHDPAPSPRALVTGVPESFDDLIGRALAKDPADRFPSAGDLGRAALVAAGRLAGIPPERRVATGAAAPPGDKPTVVSPEDTPTVRVAPGGGDDELSPTALAPGRGGARRRRPLALFVAAPLVVAAVALAAVLAFGGGGDDHGGGPGAGTSATTATATMPSGPAKAEPTIRVASRPNDVVVTKDYAFAVSGIDGKVVGVAQDGDVPAFAIQVGSGATAMTTAAGSLWVAKQSTKGVLRYRLSDRRRQGEPVSIAPGVPFSIAAGDGSIWVGARSGLGGRGFVPQTVTKIDAKTQRVTETIDMPSGVQDLDVGAHAVWVANRRRNTVTRIDIRTGAKTAIDIGGRPSAITYGAGAVWATIASLNSVVRIDVATLNHVRIGVGAQPKGVATGGDVVWVSNEGDSTLSRIDPRTNRVSGDPIDVGLNPKALAVYGRTVWVAAVGEDGLTKVTF